MQINWTILTYLVIAIFIINGFQKGWWKEAITTFALAILLALLQSPNMAQAILNLFNNGTATIWNILPNSLVLLLGDLFGVGFGASASGNPLEIIANNQGNWLIILLLVMFVASLVSRSSLPNYGANGYAVKTTGSLFGSLVGGLNGFIFINLVREYLDGRNLPGGGVSALPTEIAAQTGNVIGTASSGIAIQAVNVPNYTILDSFLPWMVIIIALAIFLMAVKNRVVLKKNKGFRKVEYLLPYGYDKLK